MLRAIRAVMACVLCVLLYGERSVLADGAHVGVKNAANLSQLIADSARRQGVPAEAVAPIRREVEKALGETLADGDDRYPIPQVTASLESLFKVYGPALLAPNAKAGAARWIEFCIVNCYASAAPADEGSVQAAYAAFAKGIVKQIAGESPKERALVEPVLTEALMAAPRWAANNPFLPGFRRVLSDEQQGAIRNDLVPIAREYRVRFGVISDEQAAARFTAFIEARYVYGCVVATEEEAFSNNTLLGQSNWIGGARTGAQWPLILLSPVVSNRGGQ